MTIAEKPPSAVSESNEKIPGAATLIARAQALEQLRQSTGLADVIGGLSQNPLPDAFIVYPKSGAAQALDELRIELAKLPKVEQAQLDTSVAKKIGERFLRAIEGPGRGNDAGILSGIRIADHHFLPASPRFELARVHRVVEECSHD